MSPEHKKIFKNRNVEVFEVFGQKYDDAILWRSKDLIHNTVVSSGRKTVNEIGTKFGAGNITKAHPGLIFHFPEPSYDEHENNFVAVKFSVSGEFKINVFFEKGAEPKLDSKESVAKISALKKEFDSKFDYVFQLSDKGFNSSQISMAKSALSDMMGGIGFFDGEELIEKLSEKSTKKESKDSEPQTKKSGGNVKTIDSLDLELEDEDDVDIHDKSPQKNDSKVDSSSSNIESEKHKIRDKSKTLFTSTPSRSAFPRGFLWDEGFHQMLIGEFDNDISLEIIKSWFDTMDDDGWISREKILGEEARSRVPGEFQIQRKNIANPPTLFMAIQKYVYKLEEHLLEQENIETSVFNKDIEGIIEFYLNSPKFSPGIHLTHSTSLGIKWLDEIYPKLKLHFNWINTTQFGDLSIHRASRNPENEYCYRWRGRTVNHTLASGLDDYPRSFPPSDHELHVDLISWSALMAKVLSQVAEVLGNGVEEEFYKKVHKDIVKNINALHWSEKEKMYCDLTVDERGKSMHLCHKGYLSLFPMMLGLVSPKSEKLGHILNLVSSKKHLWSDYGIRSLSASSEYYGLGENYWRGPIWMNMNYLVLSSLYKNYAKTSGPYKNKSKKIYDELRTNVIDTIHKSYVETGFFWEQYNPETGKGQRAHPFTGWTALVPLIMAEKY
ncbi:hypothetical protein BB559_002318 [Furculomyces boomerangus]|uniref:mannosyl-oligosaccharide glucosidase n=1 Tax=Furculomyces boomerangus TaxID=61424 RepID=A0A2T9YWB5_9FUNG|nr:hypothetical protein BB559_002318 [Furculomyces boomerangus]